MTTGQITPLMVDARDAAAMLSISRSLLYQLLSAGQFPEPVRINSKTLWRVADLQKWVESGCRRAGK